MKISIARIHQTAALRPAGYEQEVLGAGEIQGEWLIIAPDAYGKLCAKYSQATNLGQAGTCCGKQAAPQPPTRAAAFPPMTTQLKNVSKAGIRAATALVTGGKVRRSEAEIERIKGICQSHTDCFDAASERCRKCGCRLGLPLLGKWQFATEKCPLGFW